MRGRKTKKKKNNITFIEGEWIEGNMRGRKDKKKIKKK
jgi:hypothetical protein